MVATANLRIFCPVIDLTDLHNTLSAEPTKSMRPYMKPGSIVIVAHHASSIVKGKTRLTSEVTFPWQEETDIVSPDFLHSVDNPRVNNFLRELLIKNN